jgi:hypothetical protein
MDSATKVFWWARGVCVELDCAAVRVMRIV